MKRVLFIDLDDTLIHALSDNQFPTFIGDMKLDTDVLESIARLASSCGASGNKMLYVFIVSNQGGISAGFVDLHAFNVKIEFIAEAIRDYMRNRWIENVEVQFQFCTSNDKDDSMRKPNRGMFDMMRRTYLPTELVDDYSSMMMIGDASGKEGDYSDSDRVFADNCGIYYMDVNDFKNTYIWKEM